MRATVGLAVGTAVRLAVGDPRRSHCGRWLCTYPPAHQSAHTACCGGKQMPASQREQPLASRQPQFHTSGDYQVLTSANCLFAFLQSPRRRAQARISPLRVQIPTNCSIYILVLGFEHCVARSLRAAPSGRGRCVPHRNSQCLLNNKAALQKNQGQVTVYICAQQGCAQA